MGVRAYFPSRTFVGKRFAHELSELRYYNTAVLALSSGAALIAYEIAKRTYSPMGLLLTKDVVLPDNQTLFGVMTGTGSFTNQISMPKAYVDEFAMEYRNAIDSSKVVALHDLNVVGNKVVLDPHLFSNKRAILVNDMTMDGTEFKAGLDYLHPIRTEKTILVSAVAKTDAVYRLRELADQVLVAHSTDNDFPSNHYFEDDSVPDTADLIALMQNTLIQDE